MTALGVIPARISSSRLPRKPLLPLGSRSMIEWVYRSASACKGFDEVVVATDSEEIADCVKRFGGQVEMTDAVHASGTDRVAEVAARRDDELIVNIQGDQPFMSPDVLSRLLGALEDERDVGICTLAVPYEDDVSRHEPSSVSVVTDVHGRALYFSRYPIPHDAARTSIRLKHIGVYGFRRPALMEFTSLPPSELERKEQLEQLRALENGLPMHVTVVDHDSFEVNTQADYERAQVLAREFV